jgi:hypothetical protein
MFKVRSPGGICFAEAQMDVESPLFRIFFITGRGRRAGIGHGYDLGYLCIIFELGVAQINARIVPSEKGLSPLNPPPLKKKIAMLSDFDFHRAVKEAATISLGDMCCGPQVSLDSSSTNSITLNASATGLATPSHASSLSITCTPNSGISTQSTFLGRVDDESVAYTGSKRPCADDPDPIALIRLNLITGTTSSDQEPAYPNSKRPRTGSPDPPTPEPSILLPSVIGGTTPPELDSDLDSESWSRKWKMLHEKMKMLKEKRYNSEAKMWSHALWPRRYVICPHSDDL